MRGATALGMIETWPSLEVGAWRETRETLHRYTQIIGKVLLGTTPRVSHFWNVAFKLTAHGLATDAMPHDGRAFDVELDLVDHLVLIRTSDGGRREIELRDRPVAEFDDELMLALEQLGVHVSIWHQPVEILGDAIPFREDKKHHTYDREWVGRFWRVLLATDFVMSDFRARFIGKASPVGFFWGTFDLCAARYSGARAPRPPAGVIESEAFSHEVSEAGFWPGDSRWDQPAFYAMHAPAPPGFADAKVSPSAAFWCAPLGCFVLPYEEVRRSRSPRNALIAFFESTYAAGATLARWNRSEMERQPGHNGVTSP